MPTMELHDIYLEIRPEDIAYVKFIFESYESVGIIRTVLRQAPIGSEPQGRRQHGEPGRTVDRKKAIIVLLAVDDFLDVARAILASLKNEVPLVEIPRPDDIGDDWLMKELAAHS
ncbi:MAG: DUF4911 domain-containing protein [Deltaproteobacteria bacterium]|nr:DUF4911 domain-containing protein [Deltaproteobacteria bacterium]